MPRLQPHKEAPRQHPLWGLLIGDPLKLETSSFRTLYFTCRIVEKVLIKLIYQYRSQCPVRLQFVTCAGRLFRWYLDSFDHYQACESALEGYP